MARLAVEEPPPWHPDPREHVIRVVVDVAAARWWGPSSATTFRRCSSGGRRAVALGVGQIVGPGPLRASLRVSSERRNTANAGLMASATFPLTPRDVRNRGMRVREPHGPAGLQSRDAMRSPRFAAVLTYCDCTASRSAIRLIASR